MARYGCEEMVYGRYCIEWNDIVWGEVVYRTVLQRMEWHCVGGRGLYPFV